MPNPSGGYPRDFLRPLDADGNCPSDDPDGLEQVGCHQGPHRGLNVRNPRPGLVYMWINRDPIRRTQVRSWGAFPIKADDPEMAAFRRDMGMDAAGIDSSTLYGDVELWAISEDLQAERRAEQQRMTDAQVRSSEDDYASGAHRNPGEDYYEQQHGGALRMASRKHSTTFEGPDGRPVEVWTPQSGILARDNSDIG